MPIVVPAKPNVIVRPLAIVDFTIDFTGIAHYFISLGEGQKIRFISYLHLPQPHQIITDMAVSGLADYRGERCYEVERRSSRPDGSLCAGGTFYVALRETEVAWLLRIRRNPGQVITIEEPTARFPRRLAPGMRWEHRRIHGAVELTIGSNTWECLEVQSHASRDAHLTKLYISAEGLQVYSHRYLRKDAPAAFPIPQDAPTVSHRGFEFVSYYEDFAEFTLEQADA